MNHFASVQARSFPFFTGMGPSGTTFVDTETCAADQMLVGGGGQLGTPVAANAVLVASYPSTPGLGGTWTAVWFHDTASNASVRAYALCAS